MSSPRANLALALSAAALLALIPRPGLRPIGFLHDPMTFLLTPVQQPARWLTIKLRGERRADSPGGNDSADGKLQAQRDEAQLELRQARQEIEDLRTIIRDVSRGMELNSGLAVKQLTCSVIGFGADLSGGIVTVRAGRNEKVNKNDVVAIRGVYLMGRVVRVDERTSAVLPITQRGFGKFDGVIMLDDQTLGPECQLEPAGDGTLVGKVKYAPDSGQNSGPPMILPGMVVRLSDKEWPPSARMLVIGRITKVEPSPNQLQRLIVTVEPVQDLAHTSEVIIRIPEDASPGPSEKGARTKP